MFGLGPTELLVIALVVIILFGPRKLPELGAGLGEGIRNFRKAFREGGAIDVTPKPEEVAAQEAAKKAEAEKPQKS